MLIHSVAPPQFLTESPEIPVCVWKSLPFGHVQGYDTPQGFCVSRIQCTDPSRYLNSEYSPGHILRN